MLVASIVQAQNIDDLKLDSSEISINYRIINYPKYKSRAETYYRYTKTYNSIIGEVIDKDFQAFLSTKGAGTIFYFKFKENLSSDDLLQALLWGDDESSKKKLTEYLVLNNFLVIWRFDHISELEAVSRKKVNFILGHSHQKDGYNKTH